MKALFLSASCLALLLIAVPAAQPAAPPADPASRIETLLAQLDDDAFDVRLAADCTLRQCGKGVLPRLRQVLETTDSVEIRKRLEAIVYHLTADERVPDLIRQLGDSRSDFREQADWELRSYGASVVPFLRRELSPSLDRDRRERIEKIIADLSPAPK
jgi:hypothetical protein